MLAGKADLRHPPYGWSAEAARSDFLIDFADEGRRLLDLLEQLP
jgi:hypothetical protein